MKLINRTSYLLSNIRLVIMKMRGVYSGKLQRIPVNVQILSSRGGTIKIGNNCLVRGPGYLSCTEGNLTIGDDVFINVNCYIVARRQISIGDGCIFGPSVCIVDHDHDYKSSNMKNTFLTDSIHIGNHVWIGANSTILRGTKIGDHCVIGAGSIVSGTFENNSIIKSERSLSIREFRASN